MTVAGDSLRRNGTKDGPDAEFARRGTGTVVSVSPPRARGRRRASRTRRRTVVVVVVINLERMDTSQDCHRSPETVPQVFGERPIDQANQPLSYTEKKIVIRKLYKTSSDRGRGYRPKFDVLEKR